MFFNKTKGQKNQKIIQTSPPKNYKSTAVVSELVNSILLVVDCEIGEVEKQRYMDRVLPQVAYLTSLINVEDFFHKVLTFQPVRDGVSCDQEPTKIALDNLSRANIQKTETQRVKQPNLPSRVTILPRTESKVETTKPNKKERSVKLDLEIIEEKKVFSDLRERKIDEENQKVRKIQQELNERKKKERRNKFVFNSGFDYNGQLLPKITINRNNLVEKVLQLKLKTQKMSKKNPQPPHPSTVDSIKKEGHKRKEKSQREKSQFLQFLDCQSLTDSVQINRGIRYHTNSLVFQQKKRTLSIPDLKNSLGRRRISKPEFTQIRNYVEKKQMSKYKKIKTEQQSVKQYGLKRAFSEANINSRFRQREIINIFNPELRESMLIRLEDYEPYLVIQKEFPLEQQVDCLAKDNPLNASPTSREQEMSTKQTHSVASTHRLPPLSLKAAPPAINHQTLILSRLQEDFRSKLRI